MTTLNEQELDVILEAAHPSRPDREELLKAVVERILTARLAQVEALADDLCGDGLIEAADLRFRIFEALGLWTPEDAVPYAVRAVLPAIGGALRAALASDPTHTQNGTQA
jgi:hypothetical protein